MPVGAARAGGARIYLAGIGGVGRAFLRQVAGTGHHVVEAGSGRDAGGDALVEATCRDRAPVRVFVDCTASDTLPHRYPRLLESGAAVVAANKIGFAAYGAPWPEIESALERGAPLFFETTVGAALPVISAIAGMVEAGSAVHRIEAVLSGTLTHILQQGRGGRPFSLIVREAVGAGLTEPDPRVDLLGIDVARKAIILARTARLGIDAATVQAEPLVIPRGNTPGNTSVDEFLDGLVHFDDAFRELLPPGADESGPVYMASIRRGAVEIGVRRPGADHPCSGLAAGDSAVSIWSDYYRGSPLVIKGPGAGPEVTAHGVLVDVERAIRALARAG